MRGDGVGAVAELEVLGLGEVLYQSLANFIGFALRNVLIEVDHTSCHSTFLVRTEIDAVAFNDILAVRIDDVDYTHIIWSPLGYMPTVAMLLAGTFIAYTQQVVLCLLPKHLFLV